LQRQRNALERCLDLAPDMSKILDGSHQNLPTYAKLLTSVDATRRPPPPPQPTHLHVALRSPNKDALLFSLLCRFSISFVTVLLTSGGTLGVGVRSTAAPPPTDDLQANSFISKRRGRTDATLPDPELSRTLDA
jgi:hypothetical protein